MFEGEGDVFSESIKKKKNTLQTDPLGIEYWPSTKYSCSPALSLFVALTFIYIVFSDERTGKLASIFFVTEQHVTRQASTWCTPLFVRMSQQGLGWELPFLSFVNTPWLLNAGIRMLYRVSVLHCSSTAAGKHMLTLHCRQQTGMQLKGLPVVRMHWLRTSNLSTCYPSASCLSRMTANDQLCLTINNLNNQIDFKDCPITSDS